MYVCLQGSSFLYSYSYGIDAPDLSSSARKVAETSKPAGTKRKKKEGEKKKAFKNILSYFLSR